MKKLVSYKISSFTLTEIIISMIIMSFLALASYALFLNTGNLIQTQQAEVIKTVDVSLGYSTLYYDMYQAHTITIVNKTDIVLNNEIKQNITYMFLGEHIIRKFEQRTDTFAVPCKLIVNEYQKSNIITIHIYDNNDTIPLLFPIPQTPEILSNEIIYKQL